MDGSPHEYGPHCSPVSLRNTVAPEDRSVLSSRLPLKSNCNIASSSQIVQQQQMAAEHPPISSFSSNAPSVTSNNSVHSQSTSTVLQPQLPLYQSSLSTKAPPNGSAFMFRVQMWANNFDSGVHSMNHSAAPSVLSMSSLCAGSQMSTVSEDASTHLDLTDQQQLKFENIPANIGRGAQEGETRKAIPEVIHLLSDHDEVVVQRAATMVQNIAKMDSEQPNYAKPWINGLEVVPLLKKLLHTHPNSPGIIKAALGALFQISSRTDGLESILRVNDETNGDLLVSVIQHIKFNGGSARYAILTFHTIIAEKSKASRNIECARAAGALQAVTAFLDREANEKLLSVLIECVKILCDRCERQREIFIQLNGPAKVFHILRTFRYESLLWRSTALIRMLSNTDPRAIVASGGYDVLPFLLNHASQRVVTTALECIRNMSDVVTKDIDVLKLLDLLLQLLGAMDPSIVLYCVGILSNLLANNQRNKEYVFSRNGINGLFRVLINACNIPANTVSLQQKVEDIQERALATLRHLCVGNSHHVEAQKAVFQPDCAEFLLRKLMEMRPAILKQTLQILSKVVHQDSNLINFREVCIRMSSGDQATFAKQIIVVLQAACRQLPSTQSIEEISVAELISLSLSTLQAMCKDKQLLSQIAYFIKAPAFLYCEGEKAVLLPAFCILQRFIDDDNIKGSALGLLAELATDREMAMNFAADTALISMFQHYSNSRNRVIEMFAQQAYNRSMHERNLSVNGYNTPSQNTRHTTSDPMGHVQPSYGMEYSNEQLPQQQQYSSSPYDSSSSYNNMNFYCPVQPPPVGSAQQYMSPNTGNQQRQNEVMCQEENLLQPSNGVDPPVMYGREGPSQLGVTTTSASMDYLEEQWPQDLSNLSLSENDPFANVFCSQNLDSQPRPHQSIRSNYQSVNRSHEIVPSGNYCCPGPPIMDYGPAESMHVGSPETAGSWQDPLGFSDYQM
uniref:Armadillo/beta-catenin-like repeat protein n=1 Tax=Syphacia muris TaxID=451379 RepID=A0A0N5AVH8_9BILA